MTSALWKAQQTLAKGGWCLLPSSERLGQHHNPSTCVARCIIRDIKFCPNMSISNAECAEKSQNLTDSSGIHSHATTASKLGKIFCCLAGGENHLLWCTISMKRNPDSPSHNRKNPPWLSGNSSLVLYKTLFMWVVSNSLK